MTKQQEIAVLDKAIAALGPWLTQVRAEVESAIRSDYFPEITLREARERGRAIMEDATLRAEAIRNLAEKDAKRARDSVNNYRGNVIDDPHH